MSGMSVSHEHRRGAGGTQVVIFFTRAQIAGWEGS
jgi:hypothetical protein